MSELFVAWEENATLDYPTVLISLVADADKTSMLQAYVTPQRHRLVLCR